MFDRKLLKSNAKQSLKRFYGLALVAMLIVGVITSVGNTFTSNSVDATELSQTATEYIMSQDDADYDELMAEMQEFQDDLVTQAKPTWKSILEIAFNVLVANILVIGTSRFFLRAREYPASLAELFHGYKSNFGTNVLTMFLRSLYVTLWSLLLIVPGIIKNYEYSMIPYILAENPNISQKDAFKLSKAMTKGHKGDLFVMDLSFIGWYLLGVVCCCGVGIFFLEPYVNATWAEAYTFLKARAIESGAATQEDFTGGVVIEAAAE